ncbi:MAG: ribosome biogenesis GTPase Der [Candidatus Latescibacteria bacterium]|nr:ribosome biogenesis GTPase Der [bacterium]MBD3423658.1 ribosome biogenesis GTPase Der [Candidatus Latescibacterota bacterium]
MGSEFTVVIVGKPNSGKSTLFNRIVGKREAITHSTPGVTRDTIEEIVSWSGSRFKIIDTGGFCFSRGNYLNEEITRRVLDCSRAADLIIFLVDGLTGLTGEDQSLFKNIRRMHDKIVCAVNKIDNEKSRLNISEFYSLGVEKLFPVSAIQGVGIGDLLDEVVSRLPSSRPPVKEKRKSLNIAIIGKPNVGKSSILNRLIGDQRNIVAETPGTTRDSINLHMKYHGKDVVIVDTAGIKKKYKKERGLEGLTTMKSLRSAENADVVLAVIDASRYRITRQDMRVISIGHKSRKGMVILFNKWDLVDTGEFSFGDFKKIVYDSLPFVTYAPMLTVSAESGKRLGRIIPLCFRIQEERTKRIPTPVLNNELQRITAQNPPSFYRGGTGKIFYGTQIDIEPPTFKLFVNNSSYFPRSYRRYINNQLRKVFTFEGTAVRLLFVSREH